MNHASTPGPVAMASHTSSGVASSAISPVTSNGCVIWASSFSLGLNGWMHGDHQAVGATPLGGLVVVLGHERGDGDVSSSAKAPGRRRRRSAPRRRWRTWRRACPPFGDRVISRPTSRTSREARASSHRADSRSGGAGRVGLTAATPSARSRRRRRSRAARARSVAPAALLDQLDQAVPLELAQVVVHVLPGKADAVAARVRGRPGLGQRGEQPGTNRIQRGLGGLGGPRSPRYPTCVDHPHRKKDLSSERSVGGAG